MQTALKWSGVILVMLSGTAFARHIRTYKGTLPCQNCATIQTTLKLNESPRIASPPYWLTETYFKKDGRHTTIRTRGQYTTSRGDATNPDATVLVINDNKPEKAQRYFRRVDDRHLKLLDSQQAELPITGLNDILTRE